MTVDYETYTITQKNMADAKSKGIVSYTDDAGVADLVIAGYYPAKDDEDYNDYDTYYQVAIGDSTFSGNKKLTSLTLKEGITQIGRSAFRSCSGVTGSLTIPSSVERILNEAFFEIPCTSIVLQEGIKVIGGGAFNACAKITSIHIPASIESIEDAAFCRAPALSKMTVDEDNQYYWMVDDVLYSKDMKRLIYYPITKPDTDYVIPDGVETIGTAAIRDIEKLKTIVIPKSVILIKDRAFDSSENLEVMYYKGSESDWEAVEKRGTWDEDRGISTTKGTYAVICDYGK